jgi:hypothetical protein
MCRNKLLFEYRSFGQDFGEAEEELNQLANKNSTESESYDYYILSEANTKYNVLIRKEKLIIKELVSAGKKLEKWNVNWAENFPISKDFIENIFFPTCGIEAPQIEKEQYDIIDFIAQIINIDPDLKLVEVYKKKKEFIFNNCNCEIADNLINGAYIKTFNIESEVIEDVYSTLTILGINEAFVNTNYPAVIKQIIGLEPLKEYHIGNK